MAVRFTWQRRGTDGTVNTMIPLNCGRTQGHCSSPLPSLQLSVSTITFVLCTHNRLVVIIIQKRLFLYLIYREKCNVFIFNVFLISNLTNVKKLHNDAIHFLLIRQVEGSCFYLAFTNV